jgi:NTE family protein
MPQGSYARRSKTLLGALAMVGLLAAGCAGLRATNAPLEQIDSHSGYRPERVLRDRHIGDVGLLLSFSGGGTRASALAYGVLEELRDTAINAAGERKRLLDEVDVITSVSGGSFTSAYYGLYGDRIFEDFDERFLKRAVSRDLVLRMLLPHNFVRLLFPFFDRTQLAIGYYDKKIFDGARFADMAEAGGPWIQINSTDLSVGAPFTFVQPQFDLICSDLSEVKVAQAVTASSAVPVVFPPIVLKNRAGSCGYEYPEWLEEALASRKQSPRRYHIASEMSAYQDRDALPYLHLVDGGIADNLGVRGPLDNAVVEGGLLKRLKDVGVERRPRHLAFVVVDASTNPDNSFVDRPSVPSLAALIGSVSDTQLHRYNFETLELLRDNMEGWSEQLSREGKPLKTHLIEVAEYQINDPEDRDFFDGVPTSLGLDGETVDRLVEIGRKLVRESEEFQNLVAELGGRPRLPEHGTSDSR